MMTRRTLATAVAILLAGCVAPTKMVTNRAPDAQLARKRIYLNSYIEDSRAGSTFGPEFSPAFERRLLELLKACGTDASVRRVTGLELDSRADVVKALADFKPDTIMEIGKDYGWVAAGGGPLVRGRYKIDLFDTSSIKDLAKHLNDKEPLKAIWRATMEFSRGATMIPLETRGKAMAEELTNQMKADGFFPGCAKVQVVTGGSE